MAGKEVPPIFLSHSGKQKAFVEHLYDALQRADQNSFFDKHSLPKGQPFPSNIEEAARGCKLGVVVLSEDFLTSKWPMRELEMLVLARPSASVLPLFYKLHPCDLKAPKNLAKWRCVWEEKAGADDADKWEQAVKALDQFNSELYIDGKSEVEYIEKVVRHICTLVPNRVLYDVSSIQGHGRLAKETARQFEQACGCGARMVGLHGVGGLGKTTLCKIMANFYNGEYRGRSCLIEFPTPTDGQDRLMIECKKALKILGSLYDEQLLNEADSFDQVVQLMRDYLGRYDVFLAIDNVLESSLEAAQRILEVSFSANSKILVASRSEQVLRKLLRGHNNTSLSPLPATEHEEAFEIFQKAVKLVDLSLLSRSQIDSVLNKCRFRGEYHPLALKALGQYVRNVCRLEGLQNIDHTLPVILKEFSTARVFHGDEAVPEHSTEELQALEQAFRYENHDELAMSGDDDITQLDELHSWVSEAAAASMATFTSSTSASSPDIDSLFLSSDKLVRVLERHGISTEVRERVQKWGEDGFLFFFSDLASCIHINMPLPNYIPSCSTLVIYIGPQLSASAVRDQVCRIISRFFLPNLIHLYLVYDVYHGAKGEYMDGDGRLLELLTAASTSCTALTSLSIVCSEHGFASPFSPIYTGAVVHERKLWKKLETLLAQNIKSLTSLTLCGSLLWAEATMPNLFSSLKQNRRLTFLSLSGSQTLSPSTWQIAPILDFLQVNATVCELDLTDTPLQNNPAIAAQLRRNKETAERAKVLRSSLVPPTTVRLFFCGLPYSGKTTLSRSLAIWSNNASWISRATPTRGIDITILEKQVGAQHQRILLWDMAGQMDSMFPDLSSRAMPSMFLFVWNPFLSDSRGQTRRKGTHEFRDEFKYWLRFVASKTLRSEAFKPKVLVAITRADLPGSEHVKAWLMPHFTALQEEFQQVLQFDEEGFFHVNARDYRQAGDSLGSHVFHCAQDILKQLPAVYEACADARMLLGEMVRDHQIPPLISKDKFHELCHQELQYMDSQEMREAVALSLNDSGDLFYFKSLELVVLDTQWFCHKIRDLLNDISTKESFDTSRTGDIFFPVSVIEELLESIVNSKEHLGRFFRRRARNKVMGCDLVKLLFGLRLAFQDNSRIFLSVGLSGKAKRTLSPSNYLTSDGKGITCTYLGRRLTCKNSEWTFLTPGIFPLLQVTFHNKLHDRKFPEPVLLEQDVMAFDYDGGKVFIEFCRLEGKDHFIDILVYSPKTLDGTIEWLQENVIEEVEKVCAEPRGVQGVELVHAVIQQDSIEKFLEARDRPAVSVEKLQEQLKNHLQRKGVKITDDDDGIKSVMYTWQTTSFPTDSVVHLLGEVETGRVVRSYLEDLSKAQREISNLFAEEAETGQAQIKRQFGISQSSKKREVLYNEVCELEENVTTDLAKVGQDLRTAVLPKLCELFTFVQDGEAGQLPRFCVITEDDGFVRRVVSAIVPGLKNVRLKLLCECRRDPCHFVDGKPGLSLSTLDDGLLKRGLPHINALLKVANVVAKVGAHVAVGLGNQIPDFTEVLAGIVDSQALFDDSNPSSRVDFKQVQQWIFNILSNQNCIKGHQIYAIFGLRRILFGDYTVAWVCDRHYHQGTPWPA